MVAALFDTNILIDYLLGITQARDELAHYNRRMISIITWMEVLADPTTSRRDSLLQFLSNFETLPLNSTVALRAVDIRQASKVKLPDAIIWATAQINSLVLVTRNTKDFPETDPMVRVPYTL